MNTARAWKPTVDETAQTTPDSAIEMETVPCLLCGGENFETSVIASDTVTGLGGHFRVVRCCDCDLVFTNPRPTSASIGQFYPEEYIPYISRAWDDSWSARLRRRLEKAVLATDYGYPEPAPGAMTSFLSMLGKWKINRSRQRQSWFPYRAPGRLLDFGCGAGNFLEEMRAFGWSVEGLDMSETTAAEVEQRLDVKVHVGTLPHPDLQPESFDAITMWNSLEHVHQPRETVRAAGELLRSGGVMVIGVPNFESWGYQKFGLDWQGLELPRHLTHFTPGSLREVLQREGYDVLSCDQISRVGWIRKSARRALKSGRGSGGVKFLKMKQIALRVANWTERTGQADFIRAVAQKR